MLFVEASICFLHADPETRYAKTLIVVFLSNIFGLNNLGLLLEFRLVVGIGRSGMMIGRLCLKMVS